MVSDSVGGRILYRANADRFSKLFGRSSNLITDIKLSGLPLAYHLLQYKNVDITTTDILQDEIKDRHDAYAKLEKAHDDLVIENQRLVRENKRYKKKLSKARSSIDSQLKRPLQADDFKYPYSVDATDQNLLAIRKCL